MCVAGGGGDFWAEERILIAESSSVTERQTLLVNPSGVNHVRHKLKSV